MSNNKITILVDTREHISKDKTINKKRRVTNYFDNHSIEWKVVKLDEGDYQLENYNGVVVDTKKDINELVTDFFFQTQRFTNECVRCLSKNKKLILLVEEQCNKDKMLKWRAKKDSSGNRYHNVNGEMVYKKMKYYVSNYKVAFVFCDKHSTGRKIVEILTDYYNKKLNEKMNKDS